MHILSLLDAMEDSLHRWLTSVPALPIPKFCSFHQKKKFIFLPMYLVSP